MFQNELSISNKNNLFSQIILKKGDVFDERALEESKKSINEFFEKDGFTFVKIDHKILNKDNKNILI